MPDTTARAMSQGHGSDPHSAPCRWWMPGRGLGPRLGAMLGLGLPRKEEGGG